MATIHEMYEEADKDSWMYVSESRVKHWEDEINKILPHVPTVNISGLDIVGLVEFRNKAIRYGINDLVSIVTKKLADCSFKALEEAKLAHERLAQEPERNWDRQRYVDGKYNQAIKGIQSVTRSETGETVKDRIGEENYSKLLDLALAGELSVIPEVDADVYAKMVKDSQDPSKPPFHVDTVERYFSKFTNSSMSQQEIEDMGKVLSKLPPQDLHGHSDLYAARNLLANIPKDSQQTHAAIKDILSNRSSFFPTHTLKILTKLRPSDVFEYCINQTSYDFGFFGERFNQAIKSIPQEEREKLLLHHLEKSVTAKNADGAARFSRSLFQNGAVRAGTELVGAAKDMLDDYGVDAIGKNGRFSSIAHGADWESHKNNKLVNNFVKNPTVENLARVQDGVSNDFLGANNIRHSFDRLADTLLQHPNLLSGPRQASFFFNMMDGNHSGFSRSVLKKILDTNHTHFTNSQKGIQTVQPEVRDGFANLLGGIVARHLGFAPMSSMYGTDVEELFSKDSMDNSSISSLSTDYEDSLRDLVEHLKRRSEEHDDGTPEGFKQAHEKLEAYQALDGISDHYASSIGKKVVPSENQAHQIDDEHKRGIAVMQVQPQTSGLRAIRSMLNERGSLSVKDVSSKLNPFRRTEQNESFVPDWEQFLDNEDNVSIQKLEEYKEKIAGTPQARSAIPKIDKLIQHLQANPKPNIDQTLQIHQWLDSAKDKLGWNPDREDIKQEIARYEQALAPHRVRYLPAELRNGFPVKKKVVTENKLLDWSPISVGGNIHPDKLEEAITKSPTVNVGFHTGRFVLGLQQHDYGEQKVLTLDVTPEQIKQLKEEGLYEAYVAMHKKLPVVMHPQNRYGLGWIRWTEHTEDPNNPKQPLHIHIDEVQSDWDDQIAKYANLLGPEGLEKGKRIREILFHGHEPGELIHETFQQHIRNNHDVENKPVVWSVWDKDSKKKMRISGLDISRPPPVDWNVNYQSHPIAMGGKKSKYSSTAYVLPKGTVNLTGPGGMPLTMLPDDYEGNPNVPTSQTNADLQGEPMYEGLVHKFEEFVQFFDKLQKEEGQSVSQIEKMIEGMLDASGNYLIESASHNPAQLQEEVKKFQDLIDQLPHIKSSEETIRDDAGLLVGALADLARFSRNTETQDRLKEDLAVSIMKYTLNHLGTIPKSNKQATNALNNVLAAAAQYQGFAGFEDEALQDRFFREGVIHNPDRKKMLTGTTMNQLYFRKLEQIADNPNEPPIPLSALETLKDSYARDHDMGRGPENRYLGLLRKVMPRTVDDLTSDSTGLALLKKVIMAPENMKWLSDSLEKAGKSMTPDVVRNVIAATSKEIDDSHQYGLIPALDRTLSQMFPDQYAEAMLVSPLAPHMAGEKFSRGLGRDEDKMLHHIIKAAYMSDLSPEERKVMVGRARIILAEEFSEGVKDPVSARLLLDHYMKTGEDIIGNADLHDTKIQMQYFKFKKDKLLKEFQENPNKDTARALQDIRIPDKHVSREDRQGLRDSVDKEFENAFAAYAKKGVDADVFNDALNMSGRAYLKHVLLHRAIEEKDHDLLDKVSDYAPDTESARRVLQYPSYDGLKSLTDRDLADHVEQFMKEKKERFEATPIANRTSQEVRRHQLSMGILATYLSEKGRLILPESNRAHTVQPEFKQGIGFIDVQPHSSGLRAIRTKLREMGGKLLSIKDVSAKLNPFRRTEEKESMVDDWTPFENENGNLSIEKLQNYREYISTTPQARSVVPKLDRLMDYIIHGQPEIEIKSSDLPPQLRSSPVKKKVVNSSTVVDWNPISHSGNIHPQKLDEAIAQSPSLKVGYHLGTFILGAQQHTKSPQRVMVLNVTPEQIQKIKDEGLFDVYDRLRGQLPRGSHPQNKSGLGWVRWTQQGDEAPDSSAPVHMHIDEVQSDWDGTPASLAGQAGVYEPITPDRYHPFHTMNDENKAKASANTKKLLEDYAKIRKILFQGMEPGQLIHEALQQHVRNTFDVEKKPILWSVWSKKSKKKMGISGLDVNREPPVDWNVAYNQHPVAMGGEEEQYSQHVNRTSPQVPPFTPTSQTNPSLQGEPTIGGRVHKSEGLDREEIKLGVKTEMEHTKNAKEALKIALDHLNEDPRYYSKARECGLIKFDLFLR